MAIPPCRSLFTCLAFAISLAKIEAATFTVTTPGDDGPGSLRQAILEANLSPGPHTITFAIFSDVALRSPLPVVSTDVSIINDRFLGGVGGNGDDGSPPVGRLFECAPGHTIAITGLVLQYTSDTSGGSALLNHGSAVTLRNCRFFSCAGSAVKSSAAATHSARTELIDCSFVMYAPGEQAIDNSSPGPTTLLVTNSSFFGSSVASTDAIVHNRSIATLTNCTFSLDTGSRAGAIAVDNDGSTASLTLRNDTLFGQSGGETIPLVVNSGATTVGNCIFKTSGSTISVANADGATFSSAGHNISSDAAGGDASFQPGGWLDASGDQRNTDPLIDQQPAQNGGATETYALLPGSPSINNADPRRAPPRDGRNYVRQDAPDVGAYEVGAKIPATLGNISTRARVGTDDNVLIAGCIVSVAGHGNRIIARALGPSLPLADR
ncbi:MAG: choice-of-anchor Q domain-containing protein, partial [Chthoniobacterales bacterium]